LSVTRIEPREHRSYHLGRHSTSPEQLHVNKVATEKNELGVEGSSFSDDALEPRNIVGMGAGMKIGKKKYSERMRPPRPTIDYESQSANQMRTRASNALKATFSAELVAKGWPRNGADQAIPQNLPKHISIQAIIPTSDRDLARRDQMASPFTLTPVANRRCLNPQRATPLDYNRGIFRVALHHLRPHDRAVICPLRDPFHIHHRLAQAHWKIAL
jgi:hypothetical protein